MDCNLFFRHPKIPQSLPSLKEFVSYPLKIASIEVLRIKRKKIDFPLIFPQGRKDFYFIRSRSTEGAVGVSLAHEKIKYFFPILQQLVIPYFIGKDIRDIISLIDGVYIYRSNYKLSGLALWCCIAWTEFSLLDLFGKYTNKSIAELLGGSIIDEMPIYLSSLRRDTTPEKEVDLIGKRLNETGAKAVKFKIGGRMGRSNDIFPNRTIKLITLARKVFGNKIDIGVDANGSFNAKEAIEIGKLLENYGLAFFEEPCPFDDFESTEQVTKAIKLPIAGGEQETSFHRFREIINRRVVNILQPDLIYNGGFIRTLRVAKAAEQLKMPVTIHNARLGFDPIYVAQFACFLPDTFQEYNDFPEKAPNWFSPSLTIKNGKLRVPKGPGLGVEVDPTFLRKAQRLGIYKI
jgi:L-alanine-DL-glutamate epimerase-like enolase superfamily enzyme